MSDVCINGNCGRPASKSCGSCGCVWYCSSNCQKDDWKKIHRRRECFDTRKLLSPAHLNAIEIKETIAKMVSIASRLEELQLPTRSIEVCKKNLAFARHYLIDDAEGLSYGLTRNGEKVDNIEICEDVLLLIVKTYDHLPLSSGKIDHALPYALEMRQLLLERRDVAQIYNWDLLSYCEGYLSISYNQNDECEKAEYHSEQALIAARKYEGLDRFKVLYLALYRRSDGLFSVGSRMPCVAK